jgi:hypothetical protein
MSRNEVRFDPINSGKYESKAAPDLANCQRVDIDITIQKKPIRTITPHVPPIRRPVMTSICKGLGDRCIAFQTGIGRRFSQAAAELPSLLGGLRRRTLSRADS